jgi:hypothetical protein
MNPTDKKERGIEEKRVKKGTYTPGAEGRGRSVGIEPPWKSLRVIVFPLAFFFDISSLSLSVYW